MKLEKHVDRTVEKDKTGKVKDATSVVNAFTPFKKPDGTIRETSWTSHESSPSHLLSPWDAMESSQAVQLDDLETEEQVEEDRATTSELPSYPQIFAGLTFYINGSTAPHISDHKLKHLLSLHGGNLSIALGRKSVTHVIIGKPGSQGQGCGGGLAGTKIQKEIARQRGKAVHFVTAEWVVQSAKAGKRLAESRFEGMNLAPKGVSGIAGMFAKQAGAKRPG
jgi:hypothetical protein